jgi:hypothetical protein
MRARPRTMALVMTATVLPNFPAGMSATPCSEEFQRSLDIHHEFLHPYKLGRFNFSLVLQGQGNDFFHVLHQLVNGFSLRIAGL